MPKILTFFGRLLFEFSIHIASAAIILAAFLPISKWYINHSPILGVDFYNMAANAAYYDRHPDPRFLGYKSMSWAGYSYAIDYPSLHFYLIRPLVSHFGPQYATYYYTMGAMYLLLLSSYFLFFAISRNAVLSTVLVLLELFSTGLWGTVIWGGNLQYFATMLFFPLTAAFLVLYLKSKSRKHLVAAATIAGISTLGHPQVMISYIVPFTFFILAFGYFEQIKTSVRRRIADLLIFGILMTLVGYVQLQTVLGGIIFFLPVRVLLYLDQIIKSVLGTKLNYGYAIPSNVPEETAKAIVAFNRDQFWRFRTEVNNGFFILSAVGAILAFAAFIIGKVHRRAIGILPFLLFSGFLFAYTFALSRGFSLFHGGWYRVFWPMPIAFGALIAFGYQSFWQGFVERLGNFGNLWLRTILVGVFSAVILLSGLGFYMRTGVLQFVESMDNDRLRNKSGAFPDILNKPQTKEEFASLSGRLIPSWLDPSNKQYRLYTADQKVNIWWPTYFEMPLFRGYTDAPIGTDRTGGYFWTDIAIAQNQGRDTLVVDFNTPPEIAKNNALFLIDWFSIGFFEGGHEGSDSFNPPASYLLSDKSLFDREEEVQLPGSVEVYNNAQYGNKMHYNESIFRSLRYFKFKEGLASPIASATNATVIGFCGTFSNRESFMRTLGATNINSKQVIPLWLCESLRDLPDLSKLPLDGLVLYGYSDGGDGGAASNVDKYVKGGGKLLIDTGSDVYHTNLNKLPEFFPVYGTKRGEIGTSWDLVDFNPPVTEDGRPFMFSLATGIKGNSESILKTGPNQLVVGQNYGSGRVIWSGLNLFSLVNTHKNIKEDKFAGNLLANLFPLAQSKAPNSTADFVSNRKVRITTSGARAVILRQEYNLFESGWKAKVNGKPAPIYKTGPTFPGFMYVFIPQDLATGQVTVEFSYHGDWWTFAYTVLTILIIVLAIDYFFGGRMLRLFRRRFGKKAEVNVTAWWNKEDE